MAGDARSCSRCGYSTAIPDAPAKTKFPRALKILFFVPLFWLIAAMVFYGRFLWTGAYRGGLEMAESSAATQQALGQRIHVSGLPIGSTTQRDGVQAVQWTVPVRGQQGSGKLYGAANNALGAWEYSTLTLVPDDSARAKINLTPPPARQDIPLGFRKTIYLIPIDLNPDESLDWAPEYYKAMFGADVRLLPSIKMGSTEWDETKQQAIAEKCLDLVDEKYRDLTDDLSAAAIGVTSRDMYVRDFNWQHATEFRYGNHSGMVSSAGLKPTELLERSNTELRNSRLQKLITQNIAALGFDLPPSKDSTSSLYYKGFRSPSDLDFTSAKIVGGSGAWQPFPQTGKAMVTVTANKRKPVVWEQGIGGPIGPQGERFTVDMGTGLFAERRVDFQFEEEKSPLSFIRFYTARDNDSRSFGIGGTDSCDSYLVGEMGSYVELILPSDYRIRFEHEVRKPGAKTDVYRSKDARFATAELEGDLWRVKSKSGWTYLMPYRPELGGWHVTVLTGMIDEKGREYKMVRNDAGDLTQLTTPSGKFLNIAYGEGHRIREIHDSAGNWARYSYDPVGRLTRVDESDGSTESYTYDEKNNMLSARNGTNPPVIVNEFNSTGFITKQTLAGGDTFDYGYTMGPKTTVQRSTFRQPNGVTTSYEYTSDGYLQSLPTLAAR
jgi:YD repeat-containing protein